MKKNVWIFGLVGGFISIIWFIILLSSGGTHFENGEVYGYTTMLLAFSTIFVAIKNYRDKYNEGVVSFGKAFRIGLFITLIASTVYVATWLIYYYSGSGSKFISEYMSFMLEQKKAAGASEAELALFSKEMQEFAVMYRNPFFNALITYMEILPVGVLISLIAALIMKRKKKTDGEIPLDQPV